MSEKEGYVFEKEWVRTTVGVKKSSPIRYVQRVPV